MKSRLSDQLKIPYEITNDTKLMDLTGPEQNQEWRQFDNSYV